MEIQKIFSDQRGEKIYSILMSEEELRFYSDYVSDHTKYDRSDRIKQLRDSDILAEKKRSNLGTYVKSGKRAAVGGALGSAIGAGVGFAKGGLRGVVRGAKIGAGTGAVLGGAAGLASTHNEREQNRFVNRRLAEAKYQARRREARDWKNNTVNRDGYTYN